MYNPVPDPSLVKSHASIASTRTYLHSGYECVYDVLSTDNPTGVPLLLIHPIGVGLSRSFWQRFCAEWYRTGQRNLIFNPDLLGCGESAMPRAAYTPADWAAQLQTFLTAVVQTPVVVMVQGALLPVAIALVGLEPSLVKGLVLCCPPAWVLMTRHTPAWQHRVSWNLFDSPLGVLFYGYARRSQFLRSFSERQLFASADQVDQEWLTMLQQGADDPASRHAVFAFLAGFWRQDYSAAMAAIHQPTLIVMGETASSISREGKRDTPSERIADYLHGFPTGQSVTVPGRNVLPYESPHEFVTAVTPFVQELWG